MADQLAVVGPRAGAAPLAYTLSEPGTVDLQTVYAAFDGTGASGEFRPVLTIRAQSGAILARVFPSDTLAAGDTAEVTYAPFLRTEGGGSDGVPGHIITDEGIPLQQRAYLSFVGAAVTAYDDGVGTVVDIASGFAARKGARVYGSTVGGLASSTWTRQAFNQGTFERFDTDNYWVTSARSRLTVPSGLGGLYHVWFVVQFQDNATGARLATILKNGAGIGGNAYDVISQVAAVPGGIPTHIVASFPEIYAAGDYIELWAWQNSGVALGYAGQLAMIKLAD